MINGREKIEMMGGGGGGGGGGRQRKRGEWGSKEQGCKEIRVVNK